MKHLHVAFIIAFVLTYMELGKAQPLTEERESITVATWNLGHFSTGKKDYSLIQTSECEEKIKSYRTFIYDSIKADILFINEYESEFCQDSINGFVIAEDVLFDKYKNQRIFKKNRFVCNAIFSNRDINNSRKKLFKYNRPLKNKNKNIDWFYYITTDFVIDGDTIKLVCIHLINRAEAICQNQMMQLISEFAKYDKVIICGDTNSWNWSKFKKAGYKLANDGSLVTFPAKSYALDNIFVKGLEITDVRVVKTQLSDHYSLYCKILL